MRGKEFIEYDNPFDVGMTGLLGFASGYLAMKECETLLMLGTDFLYQRFSPEKADTIPWICVATSADAGRGSIWALSVT
jgi:pyruvate dehydrogenase (quinone)